jgi:SPX domain protein involved in polyphosphate accumulation
VSIVKHFVLQHLPVSYPPPFSDLFSLYPLFLIQGFVRSTTKYWVKTTDVSIVKHFVLQHLPVFQFEKTNFSGDAQLINSVYMDNASLELYHGRLDKRPGAIALRLRW